MSNYQDGSYNSPFLVCAVDEPSRSLTDDLSGQWVMCNTDTLMSLLDLGHTLRLPRVDFGDDVRDFYDEDELAYADAMGDDLDIVSIEYVGEEEVQCIEVSDDDHMYVTDGFIATHNTSNIVFLKSTDDSMLDTLEKMSGKTHRTYAESKMITQDVGRVVLQNEDKRSITYTTKEEPVISYNQMAFLSERQSIVFRASDPPVLNKNQMILPMSWRLFKNKIVHPGHDYSLQTIPTLSSAAEFDARKNLPQFENMVNKRLAQACYAEEAVEAYKSAFGLDDYAVEQLDPDTYSDAVMEIIQTKLNVLSGRDPDAYVEVIDAASTLGAATTESEANEEGEKVAAQATGLANELANRIYAGGVISRTDLAQYDDGGNPININHSLDEELVRIFRENMNDFERDKAHFTVRDGSLYSARTRRVYIRARDKTDAADIRTLTSMSANASVEAFERDSKLAKDEREGDFRSYDVSDEFYRFLLSLDTWNGLAYGAIERKLASVLADAE